MYQSFNSEEGIQKFFEIIKKKYTFIDDFDRKFISKHWKKKVNHDNIS